MVIPCSTQPVLTHWRLAVSLGSPIVVPLGGYLIDQHVYSVVGSAQPIFFLLMALGFLTGLIARQWWVIFYVGGVAIIWWFMRPLLFDLSGPQRTGPTMQFFIYLMVVCVPIVIGAVGGVQLAAVDEEPSSTRRVR